jgi:hypothetical protein
MAYDLFGTFIEHLLVSTFKNHSVMPVPNKEDHTCTIERIPIHRFIPYSYLVT